MIFNTIEKQLKNFTQARKHAQKKCSINYIQVHHKYQHNNILNYSQNQNKKPSLQKLNQKNLERNKVQYKQQSQIRQIQIKKLDDRLTVPLSKSLTKQNRKNTNKSNYSKKTKCQNPIFINRCHPYQFTKSESSKMKQNNSHQYNKFGSHNDLQQRVNQHSPGKSQLSYNYEIDAYASSPNSQIYQASLTQRQKQRELSLNRRRILNQKHGKQKQNELSKTAVSHGSQLYELSPIHFNKYMAFKDKNMQLIIQKDQKIVEVRKSKIEYVESHQSKQDESIFNFNNKEQTMNRQSNALKQKQKVVNTQINNVQAQKLYSHLIQQKLQERVKKTIKQQFQLLRNSLIDQNKQNIKQQYKINANLLQNKQQGEHKVYQTQSVSFCKPNIQTNPIVDAKLKQSQVKSVKVNSKIGMQKLWLYLLLGSILTLLIFQLIK